MPQNFNISAKISLQGPNNVRSVVQQIQRQLNGINANVNITVGNQVNQKLNSLNANLQRINASLLSIRQAGLNANAALIQLSQSITNLKSGGSNVNIYVKNFNNAAKAANSASNAVSSFGGQAGLAVRRFLAFAAPTTILLGLVAAIKEGVSASIEFQKEIVKVSQVTGRSLDALGNLTSEITRLSTSLGVSSKELSQVSTVLAQAGLNTKDTTKALEALARSSLAATFKDIQGTTEGAIAVFRQFNVSADDLQGVIGSLNAVSAQFAVESDDLISVIRRTGGAFKVSGGNLNELLGLFTSVRATTRESADSIATGFRTIFTRIQRPRTVQFLKELGIELQDLKGQFIGPVESIRRLHDALENIPTTDPRFASIIEELGGFRQVSKVIPLIQQFPEALKAISVAEQGQLSIVEDSITAQKSLANQIVKVKEEFLALFRELTSDKSFQFFVKTSLDLAKAIIDITKALKPLIPLLGGLALIQAGKSVGSVSANFGAALGGRKKFASGGKVPGSGSGDTVPALLTPGEFVVKKSAANAIGFNKLSQINKMAEGGPVGNRKFQIAGLKPIGFKQKDNVLVKAVVKQGKKEFPVSERFDLTAGGLSKNTSDKTIGTITNGVKKTVSSVADNFQKELGITREQPANIDTVLKNAGLDVAIGHIFESAVAVAGAPFSDKKGAGSPIDFPSGLGKVAPLFGLDPNIGTDTKATAGFKDFKRRNLVSLLKEEAKAGKVPPIITTPKSKQKQIILPPFDLKTAKKGDRASVAQMAAALGKPGLGFNALMALPEVNSKFGESRASGTKSFIKKAMGGDIGGGTDKVPSLLTPGEFVINKKAAKNIGKDNLNKLNNADKIHKFARGGAVGSTTSSAVSIGLAIPVLTSLISNFGDLGDETKKLLNTFTGLAAGAGAVSFGINSLASDRQLKLGRAGFGLKGNSLSGQTVSALATNFNELTIGIGALSAGITAFGQNMQDAALSAAKVANNQEGLNKAIEKDKSGSIITGAGIGTGLGAAIGTAIAPGIGTVIGAGLGSIVGVIAGANNSNSDALIKAFKQSKFDKVSDKLDTLFEDFTSGKAEKGSATGNIGTQLRSQLKNLSGTADLGQRQELTKQFRNNLTNVRTLSSTITEQVTSFKEFENAFGGTGKTLVEVLSVLTNKSFRDIESEITKEIVSRRNASEAAKKAAEAAKTTEVLTISIKAFGDAIQNVTDQLNQSQTVFDNILSLQGEISAPKFNAVPTGLFGRAASGSISDTSRISSAIRQLTSPLDDKSTQAIESTAVGITRLTNVLPDILNKVSAGIGAGTGEEASQRAEQTFSELLALEKDIPQSLQNVVKSIFGSELASREGGGESGAKRSIREDLPGLVSKLIPEALKTAVQQLDEINKSVQEQIDTVGKRLVAQANAELNISKQKVSLEDKIFEITKSRLRENEHLSFAQVRASAGARRAELLRGTSIAGNATISGAGGRLSQINSQLAAQQELVNTTSGQTQLDAVQKFVELSTEANRLRDFLKDLGDSTQELTHLQEELGRAEEDRKAGKSLVESLLFGEGKDRAAFGRFTQNAKAINKGQTNIGNLGPQARKEFLEFLTKLPQNKTLGLLGGGNVDQFKNQQLRASFIARAGKEGANIQDAEKLINELTTSSKEENDIRNKLIDVQNTAISATQELITADENLVAQLNTLNQNTLADLPKQIRDAVATAAIAGLEQQSKFIEKQGTTKITDFSTFKKFANEQLGTNNSRVAIEKANRINANLGNFQQRATALGDIKKFSTFKLDKSSISDFSRGLSSTIKPGTLSGTSIGKEDLNNFIQKLLPNDLENRGELEKVLVNKLSKANFTQGNKSIAPDQFNEKGIGLTGQTTLVGGEEGLRKALIKLVNDSVSEFTHNKVNEASNKAGESFIKLSSNGFNKEEITKFSDNDAIKKFTESLATFSPELLRSADAVDKLLIEISKLKAEFDSLNIQIDTLRPTPAAPKASGGLIGSRGIGSSITRFTPRGTDRVPAMLTAGEFVVRRSAAQANLPLLQEINAQGFAIGGKVKKPTRKERLAAFAAAQQIKKDAFKATHLTPTEQVKKQALSPFDEFGKPLTRDEFLNRDLKKTINRAVASIPIDNAGAFARKGVDAQKEFARRTEEIKKKAKADREAFDIANQNRRAKAVQPVPGEQVQSAFDRFQDANKPVPSQTLPNALEAADRFKQSKEKVSSLFPSKGFITDILEERRQKEIRDEFNSLSPEEKKFRKSFGKFANGGSVPGSGDTDHVPALLTPGEFVLNRRAAKSLGLATLSNFNRKFANGGAVTANAGGNAGGTLTLDDASLASLNSFSKSFESNIANFGGTLSKFSEASSTLSNALSRWTGAASQLSETLSSFPSEIQVTHSPITMAVNIAGLEGLEAAVSDKVLARVNEQLNTQRAKAADGKPPALIK